MNAPVVPVFWNTAVVTNTLPVVMKRTDLVFGTNEVSGAVGGWGKSR